MKRFAAGVVCVLCLYAGTAAASTESPVWTGYLDYAYIYSSADSASLKTRLDQWSQEAGIPLDRYINEYFETLAPLENEEGEAATRRKAIAYLLDYLALGDTTALDKSVRTVRALGGWMERHENRFWYHYVLAHKALERNNAREFADHVMQLWSQVIVPLESTYTTLETLSLNESPNAGFSSALPYLYESVSRLILLRSQEMGVDRDLDALGAVVRMLHDGRIGSSPDLIPVEVSSKAYLDRIVERLDGAESDDGSLTFTLALFEASKFHDGARGRLAESGLDSDTLRAISRAAGAYETALNRARTTQGQCAVYTRVLRLIGELYAAQQRLGVDAAVALPFSIEGSMRVYGKLREKLNGGYEELGYRSVPRPAYIDAMQRLWEEIQEASLNVGDYYLSRAAAVPLRANEHARSAARAYGRYLALFHQYATEDGVEALPDSAYFAAFEAAKGIGDAFLRHATNPTAAEESLGIERWRSALLLFPFDREIWPSLTAALGRRGRESEYVLLVQPITERVGRSRAVSTWIDHNEAHAKEIASVRQALADPLVVMYMGFADPSNLGALERELNELRAKRTSMEQELSSLRARRDALQGKRKSDVPASAGEYDEGSGNDLASVAARVAEQTAFLEKLDGQIAARSRALPIYRQTLGTTGLAAELRGRRNHPVHTLLGRLFYEGKLPADGRPSGGKE